MSTCAPTARGCVACKRPLEARALYCGTCGRRSRLRSDSKVGAILGGTYRVNAKLAEGSFGVVYRATHLPSGVELALKVLHADFSADREITTRFRRESRALANLRDPHTVTTFERGELRDGTLFIAMELLRGETLQRRLALRGRLPWRQAFAIVRGACSSLAEAHARGIVHRDIKPANLHLGDEDFVKVLDFGVARFEPGSELADDDELTLAGQVVGTLEYMPPEQLAGAGSSQRSDIYALGVVAFEMICGRRPFPHARDPASLATALFTECPPVPSSIFPVPAAVDQLILRCLERDPAHRFANVQELVVAIDRALQPPRAPVLPRVASSHHVQELPVFEAPVRGSVVEWPSPPKMDRVLTHVLGAMISVVGAAIAWVALS